MADQSKEKKQSLKITLGSVKLEDAGHVIGQSKMVEPSYNKDTKSYPSVYVSTKDVPGLEGYEAGDYVTLVVHACVRSHSIDESKNSKKRENFSLDLEKIGVVAAKDKEGKKD